MASFCPHGDHRIHRAGRLSLVMTCLSKMPCWKPRWSDIIIISMPHAGLRTHHQPKQSLKDIIVRCATRDIQACKEGPMSLLYINCRLDSGLQKLLTPVTCLWQQICELVCSVWLNSPCLGPRRHLWKQGRRHCNRESMWLFYQSSGTNPPQRLACHAAPRWTAAPIGFRRNICAACWRWIL